MVKPRSALRIPGTIARELGVQIVSGKYQPGAVMEGEVAASLQRHVSRSAYREAVRILAAKGLVDSRPKMGTRVSEVSKWQLLDPDVLSWVFMSEPREELLVGLFQLRRIVEPGTAALAARHRTDAQVRQMEAALARMAQYTIKTEEGRLADEEFHVLLLAASGNPFLVSLTSGIASAVSQTIQFKTRKLTIRRDPVPEHLKVFHAVAAGDADAAYAAMLDLVNLAFDDTSRAMTGPQD